jgi:PAS domain S-box-containing protein
MTLALAPDGLNAALLEAAQEGICTADAAGVITYANPRMGALLGAPAADLVGRSIFERIAPGAVETARERFARRTQGAAMPPQDVPFVRVDGTLVWLRIAAGTLRTPDGSFGGAVYLASDVTAEHAAKDELARSERYFRALIERASEMVAVLSPEGYILYATPTWLELLGYTPDEVVGINAMTLIHPDDLALVAGTLERVATAPGSSATVEYRVIHKDGSTRIFHSIGRNLLDDEAVRGIVVNSYDVTERRRTEEQQRQQSELLERIFAHIPAMITFYGPDGHSRYANAEWERVTGWSRAERATIPFFDHLFPDPVLRAKVRACIEAAVPGEWHEWVMHTRDGSTRDTIWTNLRLSDGSIVCFGRDITEERRLAAQLRQAQKMEAVGQLTAGIAHDFNNLLQVITGNAYFARESLPPGSSAVADLAQIQSAAERAAALTRQLLAFSRQQVLHPAPVELDDIVAEMEEMLQRTLGEHIVLATQLEGGIIVNADRHQLEQVIMNLAVNARDAMPDGGVLRIETQRVQVSDAPPAGGVRGADRPRHRRRDGCRDARTHLRAVLHDQAAGVGDRARALDGARHRAPVGRQHLRGEHAGNRHGVHGAAAVRGRARAVARRRCTARDGRRGRDDPPGGGQRRRARDGPPAAGRRGLRRRRGAERRRGGRAAG